MPPPTNHSNLNLHVLPDACFVVKLDSTDAVPQAVLDTLAKPTGKLISITRTSEELSIAGSWQESYPAEFKPGCTWRCIKIQGPMDFGLIGVIAQFTEPLKAAGVPVFVTSTCAACFILPPYSVMDPSSSTLSAQLPQRRVQPSRSRRGGPGVGVGNCETDQMILDTNRRKPENEPLIPENARFFLTTNPVLAPPEIPFQPPSLLNIHANERYFDRPELLKAIRQQQEIETPEYVNISETDTVGGRFRPRGSEDVRACASLLHACILNYLVVSFHQGIADTSDAAYERRHKKYEGFEKRVRLREKEKLKHEQYKLQQRIEQLRAMDYTAFLSLPASEFSPAPGRLEDDDGDGPAISSLPGAHVNGAAAMHEAERRRAEMLNVAEALEERYKLLLPPERIRKPNGSSITGTPLLPASSPPPELVDIASSTKAAVLKTHKKTFPNEGESEVEHQDQVMSSPLPAPPEEKEKVKLMIRIRNKKSQTASVVNSPTPPVSISAPVRVDKKPSRNRSKTSKAPVESNGIYVPADSPMSSPDIAFLEPSASPPKKRPRTSKRPRLEKEEAPPEPVLSTPKAPSPPPGRDDLVSSDSLTPVSDNGGPTQRQASVPPITVLDESASAPPTRRRGQSSSGQRNRSTSAAPRPRTQRAPPKPPPPKPCQILVAAKRASIQTVHRKGRNTTAFGTKVPPEMDMELEYELPLWILEDDEFQARYAKYPRATDNLNPEMVMNPKYNPGRLNFEDQLVNALNSAKDRAASVLSEEEEVKVEETDEQGEGEDGEEDEGVREGVEGEEGGEGEEGEDGEDGEEGVVEAQDEDEGRHVEIIEEGGFGRDTKEAYVDVGLHVPEEQDPLEEDAEMRDAERFEDH
ncbi:hypothetical protein PQX77_001910 [Marasmius sp. AFHP31]|nr:hypothetical protein PQX77_001910 [Marasmius sp. AFHP31]